MSEKKGEKKEEKKVDKKVNETVKDKKKKDPATSICIIIIIICLVLTSIILAYDWYCYDLEKVYTSPYSKNCFKIENDENTITVSTYYDNTKESNELIMFTETYYFSNGKFTEEVSKNYFRTKKIANEIYNHDYKNKNNRPYEVKKSKNWIETRSFPEDYTIDNDEIKMTLASFTTNEGIISYIMNDLLKDYKSEYFERIY